jgi:hypothetical protein
LYAGAHSNISWGDWNLFDQMHPKAVSRLAKKRRAAPRQDTDSYQQTMMLLKTITTFIFLLTLGFSQHVMVIKSTSGPLDDPSQHRVLQHIKRGASQLADAQTTVTAPITPSLIACSSCKQANAEPQVLDLHHLGVRRPESRAPPQA